MARRTHKHDKENEAVKKVLVGVIVLLIFLIGATIGFYAGIGVKPDRQFRPYYYAPRYQSPSPASLH